MHPIAHWVDSERLDTRAENQHTNKDRDMTEFERLKISIEEDADILVEKSRAYARYGYIVAYAEMGHITPADVIKLQKLLNLTNDEAYELQV